MVKISIVEYPSVVYYGKPLKKKKNKCIIHFSADAKERAEGKFGWDALTKKMLRNCTSDKEKLKAAYTPITVSEQDYYVPYLSMKVGQSITLSLKDSKVNYKPHIKSIAINPLPGFTITPMEIKDAEEVTLTCTAHADTVSQLTVTADNTPDPIVGALNIWHPKPKTARVTWVYVEMQGRKLDERKIGNIINLSTLQSDTQRAFEPGGMTIDWTNTSAEILDIPALRRYAQPLQEKKKATAPDPDARRRAQIQDLLDRLDTCFYHKNTHRIRHKEAQQSDFLLVLSRLYGIQQTLQGKKVHETKDLLLFLTHLKCFKKNEHESFDFINGISLTGGGVSALFLANDELRTPIDIPHEMMHAIALEHTFAPDAAVQFTKGSTNNYMDYKKGNHPRYTRHWQWKALSQSKYSR